MPKFDPQILDLDTVYPCDDDPPIESGHAFSVSLDYDTNPKNPYPIFRHEIAGHHWHIPLTKESATDLYNWLRNYLFLYAAKND